MSRKLSVISLIIIFTGVLFFGGCQEFQVSIDKMEECRVDIKSERNGLPEADSEYNEYGNLLWNSAIFIRDIQALRQAVKDKNLEEISSYLEESKISYEEMSTYANKIESEKVKLLMVEAENSFRIVIPEVEMITLEIAKSKLDLDKELGDRRTRVRSLTESHAKLQEDCSELEGKLKSLESDKRDKVKGVLTHLALWVTVALVAGFVLLILWYKKFASEEEYWGFYVKTTGRISPVTIMMFVSIATLLILTIYLLLKGYIGAIL